VLAVFELEKAIYELGYEMNNRPTGSGCPSGDPGHPEAGGGA
jgi:predicted trehalose synthase